MKKSTVHTSAYMQIRFWILNFKYLFLIKIIKLKVKKKKAKKPLDIYNITSFYIFF